MQYSVNIYITLLITTSILVNLNLESVTHIYVVESLHAHTIQFFLDNLCCAIINLFHVILHHI